MSPEEQAQMLARACSALIAKYAPISKEIRLSPSELENVPPLGIAVDDTTGDVVFAIGDA